ncbi:hypothetical protein ACFYUM_09005 [Streptomyces fimicarius]|uniref:hypothetical protein n=1 Tax=Streptomyces TaxID=1883 RepID=UPI000A37FB1C|nr:MULTISPECIES: hypothetical protein [Streptomyces]MDX3590535.1 hypothetical protein [Streptomyces sp. ID03-2B]WKN14543.1 hypothetical protein NEH83_10120 [Streptomyces sp. JUS-F4]
MNVPIAWADNLALRVSQLGDLITVTERPLLSQAGFLHPAGHEIPALSSPPAAEGDFVLTDRTLYYTPPYGDVIVIPLGAISSWRQRRSHRHPYLPAKLQRLSLLVDVDVKGSGPCTLEFGKTFAKTVKKTGGIRPRW